MTNSITTVVPGSTADQVAAAAAAPPPAPPHRRPRVREVSSRFMSPAASSSAGDLHSLTMKSPISRSNHSVSTPMPDRSSKPSSSHRRLVLRSHEQEPLSSSASFSSSHENIPETLRSMDTPFQHAKPDTFSIHRKQSAKENGFGVQKLKSTSLRTGKASRSDTPIASAATERIVPSRFRLPQRPTSSSVTDAAKLLQSTGLSFSSSNLSSNIDSTIAISQSFVESQPSSNESEQKQGGSNSCPNSPISFQHNRTWPRPDTRSSMTEEDALSTRLLVRSSSCSSTGAVANCPPLSKLSTSSLCSRSLNLPLSSGQNSFKNNSMLPPQPTSMKVGVDSRKTRKPQSSQEDIHTLKMMHNHYLQWRYANAKAEVSMHKQKTSMENQFFSFGADITNLRDTVKKKQVELAKLQRIKAVSTILDAQMPYLDEWSGLEEDYTCSLSGATNALTNSLLRLPVTGNVQVNIKEAAEALDSAVKTTEMIVNYMERFLPKAEEMDSMISELATVINVEKALVEECGNLLANTHTSQVTECSLRGHLIQLHSSNVS